MMEIAIKRAYAPAEAQDGDRVLVDRLWPRGLSKARAALSLWDKALAPSDGLRHWYDHDPAKWPEFRRRYFAELDANAAAVDALREMAGRGKVTLIYASREERLNNAVALRDYMAGVRA
ncbi:MAG: DUF488 family protein [Paracoccus sp. (in: a-proteobacteria)]|nr:DUF488 family protein [Paracoccus sp. (in: a-proteobacteria)]